MIRKSKLGVGETKRDKGFDWGRQKTPVIEGKHIDLKALTSFDNEVFDEATLKNPIDVRFNKLSRRLTMVERPHRIRETDNKKKQIENDLSAKGKFQKWNLYASYPYYACMLIEMSRIFNSFVLTEYKQNKNKRGCKRKPTTSAQRMYLVYEQFDIYDIIEFSVANEVLKTKDTS